ncbi:MAG TPA: hypothetical protein VFU22_08270 [Roseiflexaceae bacterium]|nr:hypothetical protein [Roseiflexaceae bacterium]
MRSRYLRTVLMTALLAGALAACGRSTDAQPAERPTAASVEIAPDSDALEMAEAIASGESPASSSTEIAPFSLPLDAQLPRGVTYASMDWSITEAKIDNTIISLFGSDKRTDEYRAARMMLSIDNPLSRYASIDRDIVRLRLGDGQIYKPDSSTMVDLPEGHDQTVSRLVFRVPADATWKDAALVIGEAGREPAELMLEGPAPEQEFPAALASGASATAQETEYMIMAAALDLDHHDDRAEQGKRFLALDMRVTFNGKPNLALTGDHFRLMLDGAPIAPVESMIELVDANSAKEGQVVFEVPASATAAMLQVGEAGEGETAQIPLDLMAAMAGR